MRKISRRDFLRIIGTGTSAVAINQFLTSCGVKPLSPATPLTSSLNSTNTPFLPDGTREAGISPTAQSATATPFNAPELVVAHGVDPETMVRKALSALGGMERFVPRGSRVIVKPNICVAYHTYEYAATTNPWVVGTLVKLALEAGAANVQVMDFPFGGTAEQAYVKSGIDEQVRAAGGEMVPMPTFKYTTVDLPQAVSLKSTEAFKDALEADVLIDVPIAKHHGSTRLTLGMKNLMGLVLDRGSIHTNLGQRIADLTTLFRPTLTIVDAIRILMDNGPTGGNLNDVKRLDTVIVSPDIVAADSYATTLFGLQPDDIAYIKTAAKMGLGNNDLKNIRIEELNTGA
jgi:uncharacterized protein (DUF362 family)